MRTETARNLTSDRHADGNRAKFVRTERPKFRDFGSDLCQHMHGSCHNSVCSRYPYFTVYISPSLYSSIYSSRRHLGFGLHKCEILQCRGSALEGGPARPRVRGLTATAGYSSAVSTCSIRALVRGRCLPFHPMMTSIIGWIFGTRHRATIQPRLARKVT